MLDAKYIPKPRTDVIFQEIDGESVILDNAEGLIHQLNESASYIWQFSDGNNTIDAISNLLVENFSITKENAISDVSNVIENFIEKKLLK